MSEDTGFAEPGTELDLGLPPRPARPQAMALAESVAAQFHARYERLAPEHGYETREAPAVPWKQVPAQNRSLMIAVVLSLLDDGVITVPDVGEVPGPELEPLPDGEYARVEILGHDSHTGWVTESTRAGQPVMVVRNWDGFVIAEVPGHSLYRFVPLPTPLRRPAPTAAIGPPSGWREDWESPEDADAVYDDDRNPF